MLLKADFYIVCGTEKILYKRAKYPKIFSIILLFFIFFLLSCKKEQKKEVPIISEIIVHEVIDDEIEEDVIIEAEAEEDEEELPVKEIIPFREVIVINEFITEPNNILRKSPPKFMQGLYVTGYKTRRNSFDTLLEEAKNSGINTIVFDVKEMQGHVYFSITNYPQLKYTYSEPILSINNIVEKIHAHGMYAVARIVQFYNIETATHHPELQPTHKEGGYWNEKIDHPAWLDSSHPLVQAELLQIIDIVATSNVDEIQLDYVRFPTEGRLGDAVFYFQGEDEQKIIENEDYQKREKRDIIRDYIRDVREVVDRHNVKLSADIFAIVAWQRTADIRSTGQDIAYISPHIHNLHPMIYSSHFSSDFYFPAEDFIKKPYHIVKYCLEQSIKHADEDCRVIPYLQAFGWRVDYTKEYVFDQLKATIDSGSKGYIFWNANSSYEKTLEWVKEWNLARKEGVILEGYYKEIEEEEEIEDETEDEVEEENEDENKD